MVLALLAGEGEQVVPVAYFGLVGFDAYCLQATTEIADHMHNAGSVLAAVGVVVQVVQGTLRHLQQVSIVLLFVFVPLG